ncbi:5-formyltetrahydrofolate cyclo-ligase [Actinacidiphila alni]|uniref:5-formyltetrahydrofolate cyclo-ligase n=1 Tax=Actinacidiphila alni TaxID=380248 RepID=UPI00345607B0
MSEARERKTRLRTHLLHTRRMMTAAERDTASAAVLRAVRDLPEVAPPGPVAAYVSMGTEPGTRELIESLRRAGTRVLLPVLLDDNDLDWAEYEGAASLRRTERGLFEPTGPLLGPQAVTRARAVLLPGLAVDTHGVRLGRGGGSYDRVLRRLREAAVNPLLMVLLYAHEVVESVPQEPHDHPVDVAVTPEGVHRFTR